MDDEFVITVRIFGRQNKLRIPRADELTYRNAASVLNERIDYYNRRFKMDYTDILTMVAYEFAVENERLRTQYHTAPLAAADRVMALLDDVLDNDNPDDAQ